jgi:hypothetical protein
MKKAIHYSREGYNGDHTYTTICGKKVGSANYTVHPEKADCKECLKSAEHKIDLEDSSGKFRTTIKRRIFVESDILKAFEFRSAQRKAANLAKEKELKYVDRVFSQALDFAWHDLDGTWAAVKKADEIYATSSLMPLIGGSYTGAPVIFNGMCERAFKENVTGKSVYILNQLKNIHWDMIDLPLMKKAFKKNDLYMYNEDYEIIKVDVSKIKDK